jgi:hypothetical protein
MILRMVGKDRKKNYPRIPALHGFENWRYLYQNNSMDFSKGQLIFALSFALVFILALVWAYRKDKAVDKVYFKGVPWKLLLVIVLTYSFIFLVIKIIHK